MTGSNRRPYNVNVGAPLAIFVVALLTIGIPFVAHRGWEPPARTVDGQSREQEWQAERRAADDPLTLGQSDAPVELEVFSDYQCPFCAHWTRDTLPALMDYADDGQLRIVWRDANLSGEASARGSRAVFAAALQDRRLDYYEALAQNARGASDEELAYPALSELADELGLDVERFDADMRSPEASQIVRQNEEHALSEGVTRAPSFLFNGKLISGVQSTEAFIANIEAALAEQQASDTRG